MARVLAVVPDLMLASRVRESLEAAGHEVEVGAGAAGGAVDGVDADRRRPRRRGARRPLVGLGVPVLGFYSHVDVETAPGGRGGRHRPGRCRARGWPASCRSWSRRCSSRLSVEGGVDVERSLRAAPWSRSQRGPGAQDRGVEGRGAQVGQQDAQLRRLFGAVERRRRRRAGRRAPAAGGRRRIRSHGSVAATTADQVGVFIERLPGGGEDQLGVGRGAVFVDFEERTGTPWRRSATPSAFQKPVAASTLPAASEATALKPIVTRWTRAGSPPSALTSESTTASSEGRPVTPTVWPSRSRGRLHRASPRAITEASGRWTIGITPTMSRPCSRAMPRSWMSRIAKSVRPAASSFGASVDSPGCVDRQVDAGVAVEALALRRVDARVGGVRGEIEHQRRADRRARFSAAPAAAGGAGERAERPPAARQLVSSAGNPSPSPNRDRLPPQIGPRRTEEGAECRSEDFRHIWPS